MRTRVARSGSRSAMGDLMGGRRDAEMAQNGTFAKGTVAVRFELDVTLAVGLRLA